LRTTKREKFLNTTIVQRTGKQFTHDLATLVTLGNKIAEGKNMRESGKCKVNYT